MGFVSIGFVSMYLPTPAARHQPIEGATGQHSCGATAAAGARSRGLEAPRPAICLTPTARTAAAGARSPRAPAPIPTLREPLVEAFREADHPATVLAINEALGLALLERIVGRVVAFAEALGGAHAAAATAYTALQVGVVHHAAADGCLATAEDRFNQA